MEAQWLTCRLKICPLGLGFCSVAWELSQSDRKNVPALTQRGSLSPMLLGKCEGGKDILQVSLLELPRESNLGWRSLWLNDTVFILRSNSKMCGLLAIAS